MVNEVHARPVSNLPEAVGLVRAHSIPSNHGFVRQPPTGGLSPALMEANCSSGGPVSVVERRPPAVHKRRRPSPAGMPLASVYQSQVPFRWCGLTVLVVAPPGHRAVSLQPSQVWLLPTTEGDELPARRCGLARAIVSPTGHGSVIHPGCVSAHSTGGSGPAAVPCRRAGQQAAASTRQHRLLSTRRGSWDTPMKGFWACQWCDQGSRRMGPSCRACTK